MDQQYTNEIIKKKNLVRGDISKQILWAIRHDLPLDSFILPVGITQTQIKQIQILYKENSKYETKECPRNKVFYKLIKNKISSFAWEVYKDKNIIFKAPRAGKMEPSLLSLLLQDIDPENNPVNLTYRYPCLKELPGSLVNELSLLFENLQVIYPDNNSMQQIVNWLIAGLKGKTLYTFSLACPDYSVEPTGDPQCPFRHTFNEVGSGLGLIARRALNAMPLIKNTLEKFGINVVFVLAMADYEALSETILKRLDISFDEFLKRIEASRQGFKDYCSIPIESIHVTTLCDGHENWRRICTAFKNGFEKHDFGSAKINPKILTEMLNARKQLYSRWYGIKTELNDYLPILLSQGAEYATVGKIISDTYKNCLILGADHSLFAPFYSIKQTIPTLYLKRFYC